MTTTTADDRLRAIAHTLGFDVDSPIQIGGNYTSVVRDGDVLYVSGQIPRIGNEVVVTGAAGEAVSLEQARRAAQICTLRALTLVSRALGGLQAVTAVLRITVYVRSAPHFTQQSEVADGASDLLAQVLGPVGVHTRTSVGVAQLPKGATVEVDCIVKAHAG